jgi:hypothetical protein
MSWVYLRKERIMQINIRCFSCHTPFSVKQEEVEAALTLLYQEDLKHYNANCPRCGKANKVSKKQLRRAAPKWEPPKPTKKKKASEETK